MKAKASVVKTDAFSLQFTAGYAMILFGNVDIAIL